MTNTDLQLEVSRLLERNKSRDGLIFVIAMWLLSRSVIAIGMQVIAPLVCKTPPFYGDSPPLGLVRGFLPKSGWELFSHWDGKWYSEIATAGYSYADDGRWHSVAFYPLFPLLIRGGMALGMQLEVAAVFINSFAFLAALILLYFWVEDKYDSSAARWTTAVLAWCPFSLFCTVMYTEGLFLFLTASALRAFERGEYIWAAFWGALTTAARGPGLALIPAFLLTAWREKRPPLAYAAGFASALGLLCFSLYCSLRFGDALAFVHVQKAWTHPSWLDLLAQVFRFQISAISKVVMIFGSAYLLWDFRKKLSTIVLNYGFCSLALLVSSGALNSINRYAYGIVSLSISLGLLLAAKPRWGCGLMGLFGVFLLYVSVRFAGFLWVA
ncbi:mannosyltransferase family protein [Microcoleus sp. herbarium19]|uniref:mannosyltransferase family protein n=1 Tax=unclassified Microcoleus TaxID=2642155 RepID=UPI002FD0B3F0